MKSLENKVIEAILRNIPNNTSTKLQKGFIAGSFTSYMWLKLQGIIVPKYNDIDLFFRPNSNTSPEADIDGYLGLPGRISSTKREGALNTITIHGISGLKELIERFDFNACMSGFDLETRELYISSELVRFAEKQELEVVNAASPLFSALRLVKKYKAGYKCNLRKQMIILGQSLNSRSACKVLEKAQQLTVNKSKLKGLGKYLEDIKPFFKISETTELVTIGQLSEFHNFKPKIGIYSFRDLKTATDFTRNERWDKELDF